jgi:hypothetical protein
MPVGEEADAAGPPEALPATPAHVPDAVPAVPPPSKIAIEPDVPPGEIAVPDDPPMLEHTVMLPVVGPKGDAPDVIGLTPGEANSVAPRGIPVGATGEAGPMPSGDVMPSGDGPVPPICAEADPQDSSAADNTAMANLAIVAFSCAVAARTRWL